MTEPATSINSLFQKWRSGDRAAGNAMVQRVNDWFLAIATARLGEAAAKGAARAATEAFVADVARVPDGRRLRAWAHQLAVEHIHSAGKPKRGTESPSAYTRSISPVRLWAKVHRALPNEAKALARAYQAGDAHPSWSDALNARYAIKRWLRDAGLPFRVCPDAPDPDLAALAAYEAGHLTEPHAYEVERWLLTDADACRDLAEFAHLAIALRAGLTEAAAPKPAAQPTPPPPSATAAPAQAHATPATATHSAPAQAPRAAITPGDPPPPAPRTGRVAAYALAAAAALVIVGTLWWTLI